MPGMASIQLTGARHIQNDLTLLAALKDQPKIMDIFTLRFKVLFIYLNE